MKTTTRAIFIQSTFAIILWWICLLRLLDLATSYSDAIDKIAWSKEISLTALLWIVVSIARFKIYKSAQ